jgi:hypothetical protein
MTTEALNDETMEAKIKKIDGFARELKAATSAEKATLLNSIIDKQMHLLVNETSGDTAEVYEMGWALTGVMASDFVKHYIFSYFATFYEINFRNNEAEFPIKEFQETLNAAFTELEDPAVSELLNVASAVAQTYVDKHTKLDG